MIHDLATMARWPMNDFLAYPALLSDQKWKVEEQVNRAPYALTVEELRHLRDVGFKFGPFEALWIDKYLQLAQHLAERGRDLGAPAAKNLAMWMVGQRRKRRRAQLELAREQALNRIGFSWDIREERWHKRFAQFCRYLEGRPRKATQELSGWMMLMRQRWDHLPAHQRELLEKAGFVQSPQKLQEQSWEKQMREVEEYVQIHGSLRGMKEPLKGFLQRARLAYKAGRLAPEQFTRLEKTGLKWEFTRQNFEPGHVSTWELRYAQVEAYRLKCGPDLPPVYRWEDKVLINWARTQIFRWKMLSKIQRQRLRALNLQPGLSKARDWENKYARALELYRQTGPASLYYYQKADKTVGRWLTRQVERWGRLTSLQKKHLRGLGVERVNPVGRTIADRPREWQERCQKAKELFERLGPYQRATYRQANPTVTRWMRFQIPDRPVGQAYARTTKPDAPTKYLLQHLCRCDSGRRIQAAIIELPRWNVPART